MQITPESLATGSEDGEQLALMCWCANNFNKYPELKWLHHSPNGGYRDKREGGKFKAMGVKTGFPDLVLLLPRGTYHGLAIELKTLKAKKAKNAGATNEQILWGQHLKENGYGFALCHGWENAMDILVNYLEWKG